MALIRLRHTKVKFWKFANPYINITTERAAYYSKYDSSADLLLPSPDKSNMYFWNYYAWGENPGYNPTQRRGWRNIVPFRLANSLKKEQFIGSDKLTIVGETFVYPHGFASVASIGVDGNDCLIRNLITTSRDKEMNNFIEKELNIANNNILYRNGYPTEVSEANFHNISTILKCRGQNATKILTELSVALKEYKQLTRIKDEFPSLSDPKPVIFSGKHHAVIFLPYYFCAYTEPCNIGKLSLYNRNEIFNIMQVIALIEIIYDLNKALKNNQAVWPNLFQLADRSARLLGRLYGKSKNCYNTILNKELIEPHLHVINKAREYCGMLPIPCQPDI